MSKEKNDIISDEDFSDASAEGELMDGDLDDDAWDDAEFSDDDVSASEPKGKKSKAAKSGKKKSKLLPILAIVGVVVLAALYLVGNKGQTPAPQNQATPTEQQAGQDNSVYAELQKMQQPSSEETPVLPPELPEAATKGGGFLNNPEQLSEVEQLHETMQFEETTVAADQGEQPPMPAPVQTDEAVAPRSPLTPMPSAETPPPMDITADMPTIKNTGTKESDNGESALLPKAQDIALGNTSAPVAAPADNAAVEKMAVELSQMNEMLGSLSDRMGDLENKVDNAKNSSGDLKEIKAALAKLERRVDAMDSGSLEPQPHSVAPPSSSRVVAPAPSTAKSAAVPAAKGWILKAAQPGRAIVTRAGSEETYAVSVGDSLDGIGKISSVSQQDGKWAVVGTTGKIVQ